MTATAATTRASAHAQATCARAPKSGAALFGMSSFSSSALLIVRDTALAVSLFVLSVCAIAVSIGALILVAIVISIVLGLIMGPAPVKRRRQAMSKLP